MINDVGKKIVKDESLVNELYDFTKKIEINGIFVKKILFLTSLLV